MQDTEKESKQRKQIGYVTADEHRFSDIIDKVLDATGRNDESILAVWNLIIYSGTKVFRQGIGLGGTEINNAFLSAARITPEKFDEILKDK
jgi:hypothetical protein